MLGIFKSKKEQKIELVKEDKDILLAIADDRQGKVPRFEQAEAFTLTIVRDGKKVQKQILNLGGVSEDEILKLLHDLTVDAVIARTFSPKTMGTLKKSGVHMYFFDGGPNAAYQQYVCGTWAEV
jgi:predicted Fe-Mo cluster-binding NifX family protein